MSVQLSPEHIQALRDLEDHNANIRQEIDRAKSAGLDMSEIEAKLNAIEQLRAGLLKVYGAPKSRRVIG